MRCQGDKEQPKRHSVNAAHSSEIDTHLFERRGVERAGKDLVVVEG